MYKISFSPIKELFAGKTDVKTILLWLLLAGILAVSLWLRARYLWVQGLSYDEGHWLMFALLANAGYTAYTITFIGIPPLALLIIQLGAKLFGTTVAVRYPMMLLGLVGIGSIFWLFRPKRDLFGLVAGLLAAILFSSNPLYFHESSTLMAEASALALALLSLTLAQQYYYNRGLLCLFLSGVMFTLSLASKVFVIFLPLLIGFLIVLTAFISSNELRKKIVSQFVVGGGTWFLGGVIPLLIIVTIYHPLALYQEVLGFRFALREVSLAQEITPLQNITTFARMLVENHLLTVGAILGSIIGWRKRQLDVAIWLFWLALGGVVLIWHTPLRERYFLLILPALAALSSLFFTVCLFWLSYWLRQWRVQMSHITVELLLAGLVMWNLLLPAQWAFSPPFVDRHGYIFSYLTNELRDAIDYARYNTITGDCIVTDDQRFAIAAGRLVPPALTETSDARLMSRWMLSAKSIISEINSYDCPMVVYKAKRFQKHLPHLMAQLREIYFLEIKYTDELIIYTAKKNVTRKPNILLKAQLGDSITLLGIDLTPSPWYSGQKVQLATYWTTLQPTTEPYKIFLQLRDSHNQVVANFDHYPFPVPGYRYQFIPVTGGMYQITPNIGNVNFSAADIATYPTKGMVPTNLWPVGQAIREVTPMNLPSDLPNGTYYLYIGLHNPRTSTRLPIRSEITEGDQLLLSSIQVMRQ